MKFGFGRQTNLPAPTTGPDTPYSRYCKRAHEAYHQRKPTKAIRLWTKAIASHQAGVDTEDLYAILASRSAAYLATGKAKEALRDADRAIELKPAWGKGHGKRGDALISLKRYREAEQAFQRALEVESSDEAKLRLGLRVKTAQLLESDQQSHLYFRQLLPGRDICLHSWNPLRKIIFEIARQMQNIVYLVGDRRKGECWVVDACWDVRGIKQCAHQDGMKIVGAIITHAHFDHVGGTPPPPFDRYGVRVPGIKKLCTLLDDQLPVWVASGEADLFQMSTDYDPDLIRVTDNDMTLDLGEDHQLRFLHTPGHTGGSQCIMVNEDRILTGDTLFPGSCGRCDLPGGNPQAMWNTLQNLLAKLPDDLAVFPGHGYGGRLMSEIGVERREGLLKPVEMEEWLRKMPGAPQPSKTGEAVDNPTDEQ